MEQAMMDSSPDALATTPTPLLGAVTVGYFPDVAILEKQWSALPAGCYKVLVDNSADVAIAEPLALFCHRHGGELIRNASNLGLAAAINRGAQALTEQGCSLMLMLDQDSEPGPGSIGLLVESLAHLQSAEGRLGCVGPQMIDVDTGLAHGFHQIRGWRWRRVFPALDRVEPVPCSNLNGSGTLMRLDLFQHLGGLEEALFIDHVDTEWIFRVLSGGYGVWGIPAAQFGHRMGERGLRYWWGGWRVWPSRSPQRHFYLFRNAVALLRRPYVPGVWKAWAVVKLLLTAAVHLTIDRRRWAQLSAMARGCSDGLRMPTSVPGLRSRSSES